jgi:hypothetical protein
MSKVARSADLLMFEDCESFEETEQSGCHKVSKGTFDTYLIISSFGPIFNMVNKYTFLVEK